MAARRRRWVVLAQSHTRVLDLRRQRNGSLYPLGWWRRAFYTLAAALEQAHWCAEAWPRDVQVQVYDGALPIDAPVPPVLVLNPPEWLHEAPALPCGCVASLPPCSLEHAVRVGAGAPATEQRKDG